MNTPEDIHVRPLANIAEMRRFAAAEREIWQVGAGPGTVPPDLLFVLARHGGLVLGAWAGAELAGILFGFLGRTAGRLQHCSHLMGVRPAYRGRGVATALKWAQREAVLAQGLQLVTWTYDPLETPNAYLNLHTLGAICRTYYPNYYGAMPDGLNAGLPSDRFAVEWRLDSTRVAARVRHPPLAPPVLPPPINAPRRAASPGDWPQPGPWGLPVAATVAVAVPADFQALRADDPALALAWRLHAREIFPALFAAGYIADDVVLAPERRELIYLLRRGPITAMATSAAPDDGR
jgi:predicted GNAT superfamily acetyltransferase